MMNEPIGSLLMILMGQHSTGVLGIITKSVGVLFSLVHWVLPFFSRRASDFQITFSESKYVFLSLFTKLHLYFTIIYLINFFFYYYFKHPLFRKKTDFLFVQICSKIENVFFFQEFWRNISRVLDNVLLQLVARQL